MEVFISIVGSLVGKAAEYTVDPAARQLSYLFKPRTKFLNLHSKVQDLKDARERLQQSVDSANRNGEVIFDDVQRWLTEVNEKISEQAATQLQEDEEKAIKRCFMGFCPDFKSRYHFSKKADREANAIAQLLTKNDAFNVVGYLPSVEVMDIIRPIKKYEAFGSRTAAFDGVMAALEDETVSIIGVYGMGGVGKTTLVKEVAGPAREKLSFDEVVFVAVTQTPNTVNIQNKMANQLGLDLEKDSSVEVRAARVRNRLKNAKKVLVILDDIWEKQELDTLGIPLADEHKGCKILMTSRKYVVLKSMDSQEELRIDSLNEEEAWNLFKNVAGHFVERPDLQSTAKKVAQKCAGLPLALTTVANALKHKENLYEWNDALEQLKPSEKNFQVIQDEAYSAIELSYKYLKSEELKSTFLLCSIMGHDAAIQDLQKHCRGLRLFHGLDTMEKVRNRVLTLVGELKDSSLLLAGSTPERFDMHDVVCDVAISIASRDRRWLALRKEDVFEEWSIEDTMRNSELVSLKYAKVSQLPDELECPNLTFFSTHGTVEVPDNFFKRMQTLKVLEFASPGFTSLPSSIGSLKSLCALHLIDCDLKNIVILGGLRKLEILDLRRSRMKILPEEIGQITGLKLLDLSECSRLEVISPNVLSNLSRLEELYLYNSFDKWEVEGIENPRSNASLVELHHLSHLTSLELHIPNVEAIPENNLFSEKMERFKISIGDKKWGWIKLLLRKTQSLCLDGMKDVVEMQMFYHPNVESFGQLRFIEVKNCNMLQNLFSSSIVKRLCQLEKLEVSNCENFIGLVVEKEEIDENDILEFNKLRILKLNQLNRFNGLWYSKNTLQLSACLFDKKVNFPVLEELEIRGMDNLERLWADQLVEHSFSKLTSIDLRDCPKLMNVFPLSMLTRLQRLERLVIWNCPSVEEIISEEGCISSSSSGISSLSLQFIQSDVEFSNLTSLFLLKLPNLKSIHHKKMLTINWPSLKKLRMGGCEKVEIVFAASGESSSQQLLFWLDEVSS
ncbi:hypothetical protein V6N12_057533 [Hibiscus sabdariffa]|uniref:AAA+ ATPase domain-containing protein n=1 Tax=Hibiscus sabdariffa TaxID=183260 RepID=A0ABR2C5I3_9ROSI